MEELPRLRGRGKHRVHYRHIIDWLVRKPGAFENYCYRSDLFPTIWFRLAYDALREEQGPKRRAQEYLAILLLAARRGEDRVQEAIRLLLGSQQALNAEQTARLTEENAPTPVTTIAVDSVSLAVFDDLLTREDTAAGQPISWTSKPLLTELHLPTVKRIYEESARFRRARDTQLPTLSAGSSHS